MSDRPTFTVLQGDCEKPDVADLIPDRTTDFLIHTFGALFADIAWQVRRGETASVLNRLNECAEAYGHVPLPADDAAPAAGVVDTRTPAEVAEDDADFEHHATFNPKLAETCNDPSCTQSREAKAWGSAATFCDHSPPAPPASDVTPATKETDQ